MPVKNNPGFNITGGRGTQFTFDNGWTVSIQWGTYNYCDNRYCGNFGSEMEALAKEGFYRCVNAEVAAWGCDGEFMRLSDYDDVVGHVSPKEATGLLAYVSALPNDSVAGNVKPFHLWRDDAEQGEQGEQGEVVADKTSKLNEALATAANISKVVAKSAVQAALLAPVVGMILCLASS